MEGPGTAAIIARPSAPAPICHCDPGGDLVPLYPFGYSEWVFSMVGSRFVAVFLLVLGLWSGPGIAGDKPTVTVFAAASLTNALDEVVAGYNRTGVATVRASYAGSSTLARQIESGAAADIFVSADEAWMDYLGQRGLIEPGSRHDLLGNQLVLVAPAASKAQVLLEAGPALAGQLAAALGSDGRLATGDPALVPAGRYAEAALRSLGAWDAVGDRLVGTENVRMALALVARGEAPLGIVYATDVAVEPAVRVVATFPPGSHPPIRYPVALVRKPGPAAGGFLAYLRGPEATAVFRRYGFDVAP